MAAPGCDFASPQNRTGGRGGTLRLFEAGVNQPRRSTMDVVRRTLEAVGVEFIDENGGGAGVRFRKPAKGETQKR